MSPRLGSTPETGAPSYLVELSLAARGEILAGRGMTDDARAAFQAASMHLQRTLGATHPATQDALRRARS